MPLPRIPLAAAAALALASGAAAAQDAPVVVDGVFDEWAGAAAGIDDPADAPGPYADIRAVQARHDAAGVYFRITLERDMALQGMPGTLALVLDTDNDPRTGWRRYGVDGVEAAVEFSPVLEAGGRAGVMVRMADGAGGEPRLRSAYDVGVISAPTHTARQFEVRIGRGAPLRLARRIRVRVVSLDRDGAVVESAPGMVLRLSRPRARPTPPGAGRADPLARAPGTELRAVSWNVGREDLFTQPDEFGRILRALSPDLLLLDEVAGGHSAAEVEALLNRIVPGDPGWRVVYGASGGSQRGVIAVRGAPPSVAPAFGCPIPYPDSVHALAPAGAPAAQAEWLRSRLDAHVPATAAVVEAGGHRLLAVTVDLESGGAPGSAKDRLRRMEAGVIRDSLAAAAHAAEVDAVLLAGDFNLVGARDPLDAATAAPGPRVGGLHVLLPLRLDGASATTWLNPAEPFPPGRLDFVLYSPRSLGVTGAFVFSTADLSPRWRARHGVDAETSRRATDHLPIVTDLYRVPRLR